jgi:hypothetical protein
LQQTKTNQTKKKTIANGLLVSTIPHDT